MMRLKIIIAIFLITWTILISRVYFITVKSSERYEKLAEKNTIKKESIIPVRGIIYDRNREPLAVNKLGFSIEVSPHLSYKRKEPILDEILKNIVKELDGFTFEDLKKRYKKLDSPYSFENVEVIPFIPYQEFVKHYTKMSLHENLFIKPTTLRHYPNGNVASHILGYVSKADKYNRDIPQETRIIGTIGKAGLEKYYNKELEGELGFREYQVTAYNEEIAEISRKEASNNQDLVLNLDVKVQRLIHEMFSDSKFGAAIVMDAETGGIIAAGSFPEYNINKFVTGISSKEWKKMIEDFNHPFINKLVNSLYPPGSVIKPTVSLKFLESNHIDKHTKFECTGDYEFGNRNFRCWKKDGHGHVDMRESVRESCDIYYYKGSYKVGIDQIAEKLRSFGFGEQTGIDLPNEFLGIVPDKEWKLERYGKRWFIGETFITSIGQGSFLTSPMQIAKNTALLATGKMPKPSVAHKIKGKEVIPEFEEPFSESDKRHIDFIRKSMADVTNTPFGTATKYIDTPIIIAGKTGTAQVIGIPQGEKERMKESELEFYHRSHAWLTTYAPANDPKYVVTVLVEHGGHGGHAAGPIVSRIYQKMYELGYFKK